MPARNSTTIGTIGAAVIMGIGGWSTQAFAQSEVPPMQQPPGVEQSPTEQPSGVSHQRLKTFADATREVNQIDVDYQPKVESATTPQEREQVENEAMDRMVEAVEHKGMSVDEYNQIAVLAERDPAVAQQIVEYVRQGQ
jgi:hypothetical protein